MTTTADKIMALEIPADLTDDEASGYWLAREHAAKLVEAEPLQAVRAKPDWDYFQGLVNIARRSAEKAKIKFPQPNYVTLKIAEEAGEVVRGAVHYAGGRMEWDEVQGEIVQLLAMLIRFVTEGDEVNGIKPPDLVPLTPTPVDASPAPDPVSKTPTLDAMAMRKPLVWGQFREGGCVGRPKEFQYFVTQQHNGRFFCHFDESSHDHLADAQAHCDQHYQRAAIDLTPPPVDASPAPDPVSKTPALDAMAMQRAWYTAGIRAAALRYRAGSGPDSWDYFALAEAAILDLLTFERVDPPLPSPAAALAEALQRPEVKALVEALTLAANRLQRLAVEFVPGSHNFITVGEWADEALAALKGVK